LVTPKKKILSYSGLPEGHDDRDARIIARLNKIPISGTLGVLMKAKKMGIIESLKELMNRLRTDHHYWIDDATYKKVLSLSNE
jgi:hypothetical protein